MEPLNLSYGEPSTRLGGRKGVSSYEFSRLSRGRQRLSLSSLRTERPKSCCRAVRNKEDGKKKLSLLHRGKRDCSVSVVRHRIRRDWVR